MFEPDLWRRTRLPDGSVVVYRIATSDDAPLLWAHRQVALRDSEELLKAPDDFPCTEEDEKALLETYARAQGCCAFVAVIEGIRPQQTIAGHAMLSASPYRRSAHVAQLSLAVDRAWWRQGIGRGLLDLAFQWAHTEGSLSKISLQVFADNAPALALYRIAGFHEEGRLRNEVRRDCGKLVDLVLMGRAVRSASA